VPTYDIVCEECGKRSEVFLPRMIRHPDRACPACGSRSVRLGVGGGMLGAGTKEAVSECAPRGGFG
jgi:putative FmdB family regulatory protein